MTALCGLVRYGATPDYLPRTARTLLDAVKGRGSDALGLWVAPDAPVALAARPLQTLDLTADGAQPALARTKALAAIMDGYIANGAVLRRELEEAGIAFQGHGDAELLVESVAHWGLNRLLQKLEGAFAFALWDGDTRALHLVRDRIGLKPLYVMYADSLFAFASDSAALATLPEYAAHKGIDAKAVNACLQLGYVPAPLSLRAGLVCLPAGHRLMLRPEDKTLPASERWWSAASTLEEVALRGQSPDNQTQKIEKLQANLITEALRLDTAFTLLDAGAVETRNLRTGIDRYGDKPFKTIAQPDVDAVMLQNAFDTLARLPQPVCDPAAIAWWCACQSACNVAPVVMAATDLLVGEDDAPATPTRLAAWIGHIKAMLTLKARPAREAWLEKAGLWSDAGTITGTSFEPEWPVPRLEWPPARAAAYFDMSARLIEGQMPALDAIAGAHELEIRLPFTDQRILEYGLPRPLKTALDVAAWLRGPLRVRVQNLMDKPVFEKLALADTKPVIAAWDEFLAGNNAHTTRLWVYATLAAWTKHNG